MRTCRLDSSSGVTLVMSISARSVSPNPDCTARRPSPRANALEEAINMVASATPVRAKRPANSEFIFKASPNWTGVELSEPHGFRSCYRC